MHESNDSPTVIQKRVCVKYRKPSDSGTATRTNTVTMVARPIGMVSLQ